MQSDDCDGDVASRPAPLVPGEGPTRGLCEYLRWSLSGRRGDCGDEADLRAPLPPALATTELGAATSSSGVAASELGRVFERQRSLDGIERQLSYGSDYKAEDVGRAGYKPSVISYEAERRDLQDPDHAFSALNTQDMLLAGQAMHLYPPTF